jgi:hypothetical protein
MNAATVLIFNLSMGSNYFFPGKGRQAFGGEKFKFLIFYENFS